MIKKVDKIIAIFCIAVIIMSAFAGIVSGADSTSNTSSYGSLKIKITDKTTGKGLKAGFKIYFTPETGSAGWVNGGNTIYTDESTGIKELSVAYGQYIIYEIEEPNGYSLSEQDGYQSNNNRVYIDTVTISANNTAVEVECTNTTTTSNNNNNNSNTNTSEEEEEEEEEEETGNLSGPNAFTSQKQIGSTIWAARNDSQRNEKNYSKVRLKIGEPKYNTYCIDHSVNMEVKKYTVKAYANISGNTAKGYTSANDTGKTKSGNENLVLAYILNKEGLENGWGGGGIKQYAVWRYLGTWISNIGKEIGIGNAWNHAFNKNKNYNASDYNNATNLMNEAKNWAENNVNNSIRNIGNNTVEMISETTAGPFKVEYTGTIASITVRENPNDKDYINPEYITFSTDSEGKNQKDASEIESGEEFYVHCSNSSIKMGEVRVNMKPNESISAQLWFLSSTSNSQDIMKVNTYSSKSTPRVKINIVEKTKKIKLIKQDTSGKRLVAGFKIYFKPSSGNSGWINGGNTIYTNSNGEKIINNLSDGEYIIYEVEPPSEEYKLEDQDYQYVKKDYITGLYIGQVTLSNENAEAEIKCINKKTETPSTPTPPPTPTSKTGSISIHKYDGSTNLTAGFKIKTDNGWLKGDNGSYTYNNTESNAEIYYTNSPNGYKTLTDLELGTYTVYEVTPPSEYNLEDQDGYENGKVYVGSKTLTESQTSITFNKENTKKDTPPPVVTPTTGSLRIHKYDGNTQLTAGFKIKTNSGWLKGSNGSYTYNNTESNAEIYYTNSPAGYKTLTDLELGTYTVYEVEAPEGYEITKQPGYSNGKIELGTKTLTENATDINFSLENKKLVNVEGFVWDENPNGKANEYNDVFNSGTLDKLISGITVRLYGNSGFISSTTTDSSGHYKFSNIDNSLLTNGYVEFIYDNTKYVTCHTLVGNNNAVNSKAKEYDMQVGELEDDNLTGTTGANPGIAVTEQGKLTTYGYDSKTYSYSNINLGLKQKAVSQHSITETLEYVKVKMKGYTYTYKYGEDPVTMSTYVPAVSEQNSKATFTAKIYPSDVAYNVVNSTATDKLEIYVVYSMGVTNTTTTNIDDIYVEQKLYLTSLTNTFDTERYELSTESNGNNDNENNQFKLWNIQANKATYNLNNVNSVYKDGITNNETKTAYIQFRIKDNAVQKMLNRTLTVEDIENAPTIAEATGFHEYLRQDQLWKESSARKYNGAKGNASSPYYLHKSTTKSAKSSDLYLKLTLGKTRTVSGTVFEDSVINNDLKLGDGVLNDNENKIKNVTVELLNADRNTVTSLYKVNEQGAIIYQEGSNLPKAITTSDQNGVYSFEGIVPGYYYIRFTYGDGTQKIVSAGEEKSLTSNDYKSTIINTAENGAGNIIKDELERAIGSQEAINNANWYESLNNQYSVAVDDLNMREKMDSYVYSSGKDENGNTRTIASDKDGNVIGQFPMNVYSYSPMMGIAIEKNVDYNDDSDEMSVFGKFSFGIIEAPKTIVGVDISISNISLTTQVGSTILSENPVSSRSKYLTSLEQNESGKSKYAKTEIDMESIYGSDLKADYELTIKNNSEKDYIEENDAEKGYYYKYGIISSSAKEKIINVESVLNTIDSKYNIDSINKKIKVSDTKEVNIDKNDNNTINISGWGNLERGSTLSIVYDVTGLLTRDDDTGYINKAAVSSISLDKLTTLNSDFTWPGSDAENEARITFTPPTGKDKRNIYIASSIIVLVALCTGIVLLKKKVL